MTLSFRPLPAKPNQGLVEVALDLWTVEAEGCVCFRPPMQPRYPYTHRAVLIRLSHGNLFVVSPIHLTDEIRAEVDALGTVQYLVSPNHLHHLYLGDWSRAYPDAKLYGSPGLAAKRKDLSFTKILSSSTAEPDWAEQIDQCLFGTGKGWFDELVFFHRASRTVVFTDLIMDFDPETLSPLARTTTRWNQMYQHTPRGVQLAHIFDRATLRTALQTVQGWEPEIAVVAHSPWLCLEGKPQVQALLDAAFNWLRPRPPVVETSLVLGRLALLLLVILPIHAVIVLLADVIYPRLARQ